jgi:hypothetical protein
MPTMQVAGVLAAVGGGANMDIQPAVGHAYCITELFSNQVFVGGVPDIQAAFRNAVLADCIVILDPTTEVQKQHRPKELYITNVIYLRVTNTAVGAAVIGWTGHRVRPDIVMTSMFTAPNGGTVDLQPTAAQGVWRCTEIGCEVMNATNEPDLTIALIDGVTLTAQIADGARDAVWDKLLNWYISNAIYLRFAPIAGADRDVCISAVRVAKELYGAAFAVGAGATVAIQPAAGVDAVVTEVAGSVWAGVAPAGNPDATFQITDGVTPSTIIEAGSVADSLIRNRHMEIEINNAAYMQVVDTGGAGANVAYSGYVTRRWNP